MSSDDPKGADGGLKDRIALLERELAQQQRANRWLRYNLSIYRELVENLNDVVYATDQRAVVTYVSPNVEKVSGYRPSEVIGKPFIEFVHPDDLAERLPQFQKILKGMVEPSEYRMRTKDGQTVWVRTHARPIVRDGRLVGVQGTLVDITERRAAEIALKESEEKYRQLVDNAKDAIVVIQDERIRFFNPVAQELAGLPAEQVTNRPIWDFFHPEERHRVQSLYRRRIEEQPPPASITTRMIDGNGRVKHVDLTAVTITWKQSPAILAFVRDITRQKEMEEKLQRAQKMEAIGTLAGGIAHNFNNLLMGIQGNLSLIQTVMEEGHPVRERLRTIEQLVFSGSKLTSQLLGYARGGRYRLEKMDIGRLAREVSETIAATRKDVELRIHVDTQLPPIEADRSQMEQMLLNLLINGVDAMPNGGRLTIRLTSTTLVQKPKNQGPPAVCLEVIDPSLPSPARL